MAFILLTKTRPDCGCYYIPPDIPIPFSVSSRSSSPLGILCHNQLVEDEGEDGMRRDPQEMSSGTLVPPGNAFGLECLPETVKWIGVKRAADFASDGIFDRVLIVHPCESGIRGLHGDANANTGNGTCSEECPETVRGHTGRRNEVVFAQVV